MRIKPHTMQKTTITDIAKELNLTPSTVSRALAGSPRVKEKTRIVIEEKAREMGYERNLMASNLRRGVANAVGIIVPRINRQFFSNVISGAESVLNEAGYTVLICQTHEKLEDEKKALSTLLRNQVAGILISHSIETSEESHIAQAVTGDVRLVQFDRVFYDLPDAKVVNDNFQGAYQATSHLIGQGYKRIGTLAGYMTSEAYKERLEGYKQALRDAGMEVDDNIIFKDTIVKETGYAQGMLAIERGCDALYSAGDFSALGAVEAAKEQGLNIPEEFGIVGTANENFTEIMSPTLSSLELNPRRIGSLAAKAFLAPCDSENGIVTLEMELKIRESSQRLSKINTK